MRLHGAFRWCEEASVSVSGHQAVAFAKLVSMGAPKILLTNDDGWDAPRWKKRELVVITDRVELAATVY
jgi:purine nucleoside phosphorylase